MRLKQSLAAVALWAGALSGGAATAATPMCRNGNFAKVYEPASMVLVTVDTNTPLSRDFNGCPDAGPGCHQSGSSGVAAANTPLIAAPALADGWVCVYVPPGKTNDWNSGAGYVRQDVLRPYTPSASSDPTNFLGRWETDPEGNQIRIASGESGALAIIGDAYWPGRNEPEHIGTLRGQAMPVNSTLRFADDDCNVRMDILGTFLVVADLSEPGACGGANVTFTGIYQRVR
ncbi:hypothetical protein AZL_011190 [Azospirillum sp. B510]|uniref:hypothetical protein n=1 Tax=Azospirillum sp. (strain B510) TaxID=137722 RepID=UPI0001C4BF38|nr:hypothetical protein [Azospirillum sp. B510]BAI71757.1 hypothetical protein AZL_011190 [Azospirillum sp. B510]